MKSILSLPELLHWYLDAGVDEVIADSPLCRYPVSAVKPADSLLDPTVAPILPAAPADHPALACQTLRDLEQALSAYEGCALKRTCQRTVFADGNPEANVMLIGEAPGADEDRLGRPFVGASGRLLDRMLASIGLDRTSCYITNLVPWRPPGNRKPEQAETEQCLPFLVRHIELVAPRVLVLLGGAPSTTLLRRTDSITRMRGHWYDYTPPALGRVISALPTFHPAYLLRTPAHKRLAWADFLTLKKRLDGLD